MDFITDIVPNYLVPRDFEHIWKKFFSNHKIKECSGDMSVFREDIIRDYFCDCESFFTGGLGWLGNQPGFKTEEGYEEDGCSQEICRIYWDTHHKDIRYLTDVFCISCEQTFSAEKQEDGQFTAGIMNEW